MKHVSVSLQALTQSAGTGFLLMFVVQKSVCHKHGSTQPALISLGFSNINAVTELNWKTEGFSTRCC